MVRLMWAYERGDSLAIAREQEGLAPPRQRIVLVHFDTAAIGVINARRRDDDLEAFVCPAKYAAISRLGVADNGVIAECLLQIDHYRKEAIWFNDFIDLPRVIALLKERDPRLRSIEYIDWIIDYPFDRKSRLHGTSIVSL